MLVFKNLDLLKKDIKVENLSKNFYKLKIFGKYGKIEKYIKRDLNLVFNENKIGIKKEFMTKKYNSLKNTMTSLIGNGILDVNYGFSLILEIRGVGLKLSLVENNTLVLSLGYSHLVYYKLPSDIHIKFLNNKGTIFILTGMDRQKVFQTALKIKSLKKKDSYKGKGIFFFGETVKLKEGKAKAP